LDGEGEQLTRKRRVIVAVQEDDRRPDDVALRPESDDGDPERRIVDHREIRRERGADDAGPRRRS
jgi:hypothetical protein